MAEARRGKLGRNNGMTETEGSRRGTRPSALAPNGCVQQDATAGTGRKSSTGSIKGRQDQISKFSKLQNGGRKAGFRTEDCRGKAMELRGQGRSQMEFGNEGKVTVIIWDDLR